MSRYTDYTQRGRLQHGERFTEIDLAQQFIQWFNTGQRIKVRTTYPSGETFERTGTVGVTTGWKPTFLLMHRSNAHGSWDTLGAKDEVIAVQHGRKYEALESAGGL